MTDDQLPSAPEIERPRRQRSTGLYVSVIVGGAVLALLIVFIAQNTEHVKIRYLGASGTMALGLALLAAAVVGGVVIVLAGLVLNFLARRRAGSTRSRRRR